MAREKKETAEAVSAKVTGEVKRDNEIRFPKRSFLRFERYAKVRELLGAVLEDDKKYSIREVDDILKTQGGEK